MGSLQVTFKPGGAVTTAAAGYTGERCREASRPYLERLGVVAHDEPTPESAVFAEEPAPEGVSA